MRPRAGTLLVLGLLLAGCQTIDPKQHAQTLADLETSRAALTTAQADLTSANQRNSQLEAQLAEQTAAAQAASARADAEQSAISDQAAAETAATSAAAAALADSERELAESRATAKALQERVDGLTTRVSALEAAADQATAAAAIPRLTQAGALAVAAAPAAAAPAASTAAVATLEPAGTAGGDPFPVMYRGRTERRPVPGTNLFRERDPATRLVYYYHRSAGYDRPGLFLEIQQDGELWSLRLRFLIRSATDVAATLVQTGLDSQPMPDNLDYPETAFILNPGTPQARTLSLGVTARLMDLGGGVPSRSALRNAQGVEYPWTPALRSALQSALGTGEVSVLLWYPLTRTGNLSRLGAAERRSLLEMLQAWQDLSGRLE